MKGPKGFAVGRDNVNSVLKWRIASEDENLVPIARKLLIHYLISLTNLFDSDCMAS